jgi:hypothetical protein
MRVPARATNSVAIGPFVTIGICLFVLLRGRSAWLIRLVEARRARGVRPDAHDRLRWISAVTAAVFFCAGCASGRPAPLRIGAARHLTPGTAATVEGVVTVPPGLFASFTGDQGFAIEDKTGGIYVALSGSVSAPLGQGVRVAGRLSETEKMVTLSTRPDLVAPSSRQRLVEAAPVRTGAIGLATEGRLVKIRGAITRPVGDDRPYGYKIAVDDGSGGTQIFVPVSTGIDPLADPALRVGQRVTAVGFSGRYGETHEVIPRFPRDLTVDP